MPPVTKKKKELPTEVVLNIKSHQVSVHSDMTEDEMEKAIGFALQCNWHLEEMSKDFKTAHEQLQFENEWFAEINNKLTFNIEIQVMMLDLMKKEIWDEKYAEIRKQVTTCPEYLKLRQRAWF